MTIDIIISSYNGKVLLEKNLPTVLKNSSNVKQFIIIDDGSIDKTNEFIKQKYPQVTFLKNQKNLGFPKTINKAVASSSADLFVLLNNDVRPYKKYLDKCLEYFKNEKIFAVSFNEEQNSWPEVSWFDNKFQFKQGRDKELPHYSAWASGGSAIFRKTIWDKLGGFDEVYSPGYWEDIDLGWRAWKNGYFIIWEPSAKVVHKHESSFKKINQNYLSLIKQRNEIIFTHKNITDPSLVNSFRTQLIKHILKHPGYFKVVVAALKNLPKIKIQPYPLSDRQVFELINQPFNQ